jgi:ABC-type dipeptide/oligopeptide/nickel transport system ATPase subunit
MSTNFSIITDYHICAKIVNILEISPQPVWSLHIFFIWALFFILKACPQVIIMNSILIVTVIAVACINNKSTMHAERPLGAVTRFPVITPRGVITPWIFC